MSAEQLKEISNWIVKNQDQAGSELYEESVAAFEGLKKIFDSQKELNDPRGLTVFGMDTGLEVPSGFARTVEGFNRGLGIPPGTPLTGEVDANMGSLGAGANVAGQAAQAAIGMFPAARAITSGAAAIAPSVAANVASKIVSPLATKSGALVEAASATGAGIAGGVAVEEGLTGGAKNLAEMAGGMAPVFPTPAIYAYRVAKDALIDPLKRYIFSSKDQIADRASVQMRNVVWRAGGDPDKMGADLNSATFKSTPYQSTGDPILLGIEKSLSKNNPQMASDIKNIQKRDLEALQEMISAARSTGDPNLFANALEAQYARFSASLGKSFNEATERALKASNAIRISNDGVATLNKSARDIIESSIDNARKIEKNLWNKIDKDIPLDVAPLISAVRGIQAERLIRPESPLGTEMDSALKFFEMDAAGRQTTSSVLGPDGVPIQVVIPGQNPTSKDVLRFRSVMLDRARNARSGSNPDYFQSRIYNDAADEALKILEKMPMNGPLDDARAFSFALNETYRRSIIGKLTGRSGDGSEMVRPTETVDKAFMGTPEGRRLNAEELLAGSQFGEKPPSPSGMEMEKTLDALVTDLGASFDATTGLVKPRDLAKFADDNSRLLALFPEARGKLNNAAQAQRFVDSRLARDPILKSEFQKRTFGQVMANNLGAVRLEDPSRVVSSALSGDNPSRAFYRMARIAAKGGKNGRSGFANSVLDYAFSSSNTTDALKRLNQPIRSANGEIPLLEALVKTKALSQDEATNIRQLTQTIETFIGRQKDVAILENPGNIAPNKITEVLTRVFGANLAGLLPTSSSSSLIAGSAGSRAAQEEFLKLPNKKVLEVIIEANSNSDMMAALLKRTNSAAPPSVRAATENKARKAADQFAGILLRNLTPKQIPVGGLVAPAIDSAPGAANELYVTVRPEGEPRREEDIRMRAAQ